VLYFFRVHPGTPAHASLEICPRKFAMGFLTFGNQEAAKLP
jgi:hypothetical protein